MAASPVPVDRGDIQVREKWSGKEDRPGDSMAHGADLPSNGGPPDERGASDPVNAEYPRSPGEGDAGPGSRSGGTTIYREKQVKVLRSSHVFRFVLATFAFGHGQRAWAVSSVVIPCCLLLAFRRLATHGYDFTGCTSAPRLLFSTFWTRCSLSVLCSQIRFTSAACPKTLVKRTFKAVSEK